MHEQGQDSNPRSAEMNSDVLPPTLPASGSVYHCRSHSLSLGVVEQATDTLCGEVLQDLYLCVFAGAAMNTEAGIHIYTTGM
eukprot:COSAG01_NODE_3016_length_6719_cov_13.143202_3_plen_82_part_00